MIDVGVCIYICVIATSFSLLICVVMHFDDDPRVMLVQTPPAYEMMDMRLTFPQ